MSARRIRRFRESFASWAMWYLPKMQRVAGKRDASRHNRKAPSSKTSG